MTKDEIAALLTEIEGDFKKAEQEAVETLKKGAEESGKEPEKEVAGSPGGEDSSSPALDPTSDPSADASQAGPGPDASASAGAPPAPAAGAPGGDPGADVGLTPEALQAEYAQLPPEELDMHIQAALAAKEALAGAAGPGAGAPPAGPAGAPPAGPPAPPADAASAGGPPMMGKEELRINKEATGGKISAGVKKSEDQIQKLVDLVKAQQDQIESMRKNSTEDIEILTKAVRSVLETPVRKAVTSLADVPELKKTEAVAEKFKTRKDVDNFISANVEKMTKSERDLWLDFVDNKVPASKLEPMLERLTSGK